MKRLPLTPLPSETSEQAKIHRRVREEGFIDEAVVRSVVMKGACGRFHGKADEMILSSSEDDYAGWALPVASPFRSL